MRSVRPARRPLRLHRAFSVLAIDATLGAVAWVATTAAGRSPWHLASPGLARWLRAPLALVAGLAVGLGVAALLRRLTGRARWARVLREELRDNTRALSSVPVWVLAVGAALGEELLFRGALLPPCAARWGALPALAVTSVAFGLTHVPWNKRLRAWTASAAVMGFAFGALYLFTGELVAPLVAHTLINYRTLRTLRALDAQASAPAAAKPGLVLPAWIGTVRR